MFVTFFTRQHLAWLGVSCQHLLICTSGDFNQWWVGNCERVRVWSSVWHTACSADGQRQRCLHLFTRWEWKAGIGRALVCGAELQDMSLHATDSFPPLSYANSCQSPFQCLRAGTPWAVSISHPASIPALFSLRWITGVSGRPAQP